MAGQTVAATDLCIRGTPYLRNHPMQAGVGYGGMFSEPVLVEQDPSARAGGFQ